MIYLSQMLGKPVIDASGEEIGTINDIAIATGEVFPRVTSLAFKGPDKTPFMLSWRKFVDEFDGDQVTLNVEGPQIRFSYLQPDEVLLARDLLNKQIVDTQGKKVVRVNDLKLSESRSQLRLLGAEVGIRGLLRAVSPGLEKATVKVSGGRLRENVIAWNYMDLLDRDLSQVKLSVTHKRLHELHPADVADILEQLSPSQRAAVFQHLDNEAAAETISELEDEYQADVIDDLSERRASDLLAEMDPDDAADIIGDLPYDKAERLLRLMGVEDATAIRSLLGYKEKTAGGIMTPEVTTVTEDMTVAQVIEQLRADAANEDMETIYYVYVVDEKRRLDGVISLRDLLLAAPETTIDDIAKRDLISADPDDDQEEVAEAMSKYDLLAMPVVDENGKLLGIVTVDDALDVLEEEADEDLALATGSTRESGPVVSLWWWTLRRGTWVIIWAISLIAALAVTVRVQDAIRASGGFGPGNALLGITLLLPAAILMPLVLRTAEDTSSRAVTDIIAGTPGNRPSLAMRLGRESSVGVTIAAIMALFAYLITSLPTILATYPPLPAVFAVTSAVTILLTVVIGGVLGEWAGRRADLEKPVSATWLSTTAMVLSALLYLGLSFAAAYATFAIMA